MLLFVDVVVSLYDLLFDMDSNYYYHNLLKFQNWKKLMLINTMDGDNDDDSNDDNNNDDDDVDDGDDNDSNDDDGDDDNDSNDDDDDDENVSCNTF
uniref:Bm8500 n=1 Tax=Brugia malayi TaxID=6279 RepID=A0A0H5S188_BRUMA|nr:Bm8500 [Brugia malayi]